MASINTQKTYSFGNGGGGSRKRAGGPGGDDDDDDEKKAPNRKKPTDPFSAVDLGPTGTMRNLLLLLFTLANLGTKPNMLTKNRNLKDASQRLELVGQWVTALMHSPSVVQAKRFSELAEAFLHVLRACANAGLFDEVVALLCAQLSSKALEETDDDDDT